MRNNSLKKLLAATLACLSFCLISCGVVQSVKPPPDTLSGDTYKDESDHTDSKHITEIFTYNTEHEATLPVTDLHPNTTENESETDSDQTTTWDSVTSTDSDETTKSKETESTSEVESESTGLIYTSIGLFELTAYCPCEKCCGQWALSRPLDENGNVIVLTSSGERAKQGVTIAADTSIYPFGTKLKIDDCIYTVQDRGSAINGNRIDIYFESHEEALNFGRQKNIEVFLVTEMRNEE